MGRKAEVKDGDLISVTGMTSRSRLKYKSDRRALVDTLVGLGGRATLAELNEAFGFETRSIVLALAAAGWVEIVKDWDGKNPRLPTRWPRESIASNIRRRAQS